MISKFTLGNDMSVHGWLFLREPVHGVRMEYGVMDRLLQTPVTTDRIETNRENGWMDGL